MICRHQPNSSTAQFRGRLIVKVAPITPEDTRSSLASVSQKSQHKQQEVRVIFCRLASIKTKNYGNNEGDSVNNFDMKSAYYMRENFPKILRLFSPKRHLKSFLG